MVGHTLSETKKKQIISEAREHLRAHALEAYREELAKPAGKKRQGARQVAADYVALYKQETGRSINLDYSWLCRKVAGGRTRAESNASCSWLTKEETDVVINYIYY
jgi:hypothetical protein